MFPIIGIIPSNQRLEIKTSYLAEEAKTVIEAVRLNLNEQWLTMKMTAIGKYPYISMSSHRMEFPDLHIGQTSTKEIILKNSSLVPAEFTIEKINQESDVIPGFSLDTYKNVIPAGGSYLVKVTYTPTVIGLFSCTHYKVNIKGGNEDQFTCTGGAIGVDVGLSAKSITFGEISLGKNTNRVLYIHNASSLPARFQFLCDQKNAFSFSKKEGEIKPHTDIRLLITFTPTECINFYERVFCIIQNHAILV